MVKIMHQSLTKRSSSLILNKFTYLNQNFIGFIFKGSIEDMTQFLEKTGRNRNIFMSDQEEENFLTPLKLIEAK